MPDIVLLMQERRSQRGPFDPERPIATSDLKQILEAARWAPTAHNMQNFEVLVIDDKELLARVGQIESPASEVFIRENFEQLSFSEDELRRKKVGILGAQFPESWRTPGADFRAVARESGPSYLRDTMKGSPTVLVVIYDPRKRAPASEGDVLGFMSLGCAMQNMWLAAQSLGIGAQIMSVFGGEHVEKDLKALLAIPAHMKIAFAFRLGYSTAEGYGYVRVRRDAQDFAHHNRFGSRLDA
jgi:nitroreductase